MTNLTDFIDSLTGLPGSKAADISTIVSQLIDTSQDGANLSTLIDLRGIAHFVRGTFTISAFIDGEEVASYHDLAHFQDRYGFTTDQLFSYLSGEETSVQLEAWAKAIHAHQDVYNVMTTKLAQMDTSLSEIIVTSLDTISDASYDGMAKLVGLSDDDLMKRLIDKLFSDEVPDSIDDYPSVDQYDAIPLSFGSLLASKMQVADWAGVLAAPVAVLKCLYVGRKWLVNSALTLADKVMEHLVTDYAIVTRKGLSNIMRCETPFSQFIVPEEVFLASCADIGLSPLSAQDAYEYCLDKRPTIKGPGIIFSFDNINDVLHLNRFLSVDTDSTPNPLISEFWQGSDGLEDVNIYKVQAQQVSGNVIFQVPYTSIFTILSRQNDNASSSQPCSGQAILHAFNMSQLSQAIVAIIGRTYQGSRIGDALVADTPISIAASSELGGDLISIGGFHVIGSHFVPALHSGPAAFPGLAADDLDDARFYARWLNNDRMKTLSSLQVAALCYGYCHKGASTPSYAGSSNQTVDLRARADLTGLISLLFRPNATTLKDVTIENLNTYRSIFSLSPMRSWDGTFVPVTSAQALWKYGRIGLGVAVTTAAIGIGYCMLRTGTLPKWFSKATKYAKSKRMTRNVVENTSSLVRKLITGRD